MTSLSEGEAVSRPKGSDAPQQRAQLLFRDAAGERSGMAGWWVSADIDNPKQRSIELNLAIAQVVRDFPEPGRLHGLDRLRFLSSCEAKDGNLVIEQDSVGVTVQVDDNGTPFVLLGGHEGLRIPVTLAHWDEGDDAEAAMSRLAALVRERQKKEQRLRERAAVRDQQGVMTLPSETGQVLGLPVSKSGTKAARRGRLQDIMSLEPTYAPADITGAKRVIGAKVTVELDPDTRSAIARKRKRKGAKLELALPFDQVQGDQSDLVTLSWQVLQWLDPDLLLTLLACMHHATRGDGTFPAAASVIGHERGLVGADGRLDKQRRRELTAHLELLLKVKLKVTPYGSDYQDTLPLVVEVGTRKVRGKGEVPLLAIQPQLMHRMMSGKSLLMDRRVLAFKPTFQEWPLRIYWHFTTKWSLGWVGQKLHAKGGMVELKLADLLDRSGLREWRDLARTRGVQEVLRRTRSALRELAEAPGGALMHGELIDGEGVEDSVVRACPSDLLAAHLTHARGGTISYLERVEAKPQPKPKGKPKRSKAKG